MRGRGTTAVLIGALLIASTTVFGQAPREDAIWARSTDGAAITLDGVLDEPAWASAESISVQWSENAGIPGSGWKLEIGVLPKDPTHATLKLLVADNQLYLGAVIPDSSIGGGPAFNRFDGLLMAIKDHADTYAPKPPSEYFYSWWYQDCPDSMAPGKEPGFIGRWGNFPPCTERDSTQIANWDAVTVVNGLTNDDTVIDQGYTIEMRFNLTPMGYDVTQPEGDIVEWNVSVYDADWFWPINATKVSGNRVWWQGPWGNTAFYSEVRVHARPDVTIHSGPVPVIEPELRISNGIAYDPPIIDGALDETVWDNVPSFDIRWDDSTLRETYPAVGPHRAGQYQPEVNGGLAAVLDPADATVKLFFREDTLYFGFDVRDQVVQYHPEFDRWDGVLISIDDRGQLSADSTLLSQRLSFQVAGDGSALPGDYLPYLIDSLGGARLALALKGGTTVDTFGVTPDSGYTAELAIDLTKFGYPPGRGDGSFFFGINLLDGDSFLPTSDSYGTRTWWFREYNGTCCPVWAYLDPTCLTVGVEEADQPRKPGVLGNFPNPFRGGTTVRYMLPERSDVTIEVFDIRGRLVSKQNLGDQEAGLRSFDLRNIDGSAGVYFYRIRSVNGRTGARNGSTTGKMTLIR
ncbi:MAG: T9SS type A sorting domain-containing protein [Candidatus Eisenbacteria bacterium]|nr:T9SS type A sorting domain-containing protein [Candidatus Eisenbacteria bacterium]